MCLKISNIMSLLLSHFKVNDWKIAWLDMKHVNSLQSFQGLEELLSGFGISPKYGAGIWKTISILTGSGIWLFPREAGLTKNWGWDAGFMFACLLGMSETVPSNRFWWPKRINQVSAKWCLLSNQTPYGVSG